MLQEKRAITERQSAQQSWLKEVSSSLLHKQYHKMTADLVAINCGNNYHDRKHTARLSLSYASLILFSV